jgi:hypothetical protein
MVFPTSPVVGQVFTSGGRSWVWNGATWDSPRTDNLQDIPSLSGGNTFTGVQNFTTPIAVPSGGTGAATLTSGGYLKGAGTSAITSQTGIPAGDITSGTLGIARGGTGATTLTSGAYLKGAGTSAITAQDGIPAGDITSGTLPVGRGGTGVITGPGLIFIKSQVVGSGVTSVTVTDAFSSQYDNYVITMHSGVTSGGNNMGFRFANITSAVYSAYGYYGAFGSGGLNGYGASGSTGWVDFSPTSAFDYSFVATIFSPFLNRRKFGRVHGMSPGGVHEFALHCDSAVSATSFVLFPSGGTMSGGTINVYGYRKA